MHSCHRLGYWLTIQVVNWLVMPAPSARTTGMIGIDGSAWPLLSAVIAGSFQLVILLVKIFAIVSPDSRRLRTSLPPTSTWYGNDVPPETTGR